MVSTSISARLKYLDNASKCLQVSSPAISAHLQSERNITSDEVDDVASKRIDRSCNACGNVLIPGWSCERVRAANKSQEGRKSRSHNLAYRQRKLRCSMCTGITTVDAERAPQAKKDLKSTYDPTETHKGKAKTAPTFTPQPKADDIRNSNRRARSKKSTLQSLLADQKKTEVEKPKGFGLDLMDLMQR